MSLLLLACSLLFSLGLRLRGRHALFPPRGEEKKEEVKPERHAAPNGTGAGAAVLVRRGLPAVELAVVARGELLEAVAEAGDVLAVDPQLARGAQRPLLLLAAASNVATS
jgi:hypothetical protein